MMKKLSPRARFIKLADGLEVKRCVWDALMLASSHDPDHAKELRDLRIRIEVLERQMERIGAPQYRLVRKGKA